ncbi:magnesium transporter CorA family protein [Malikia spinosa]|uniref:Magnesium transporter CorA family protein n=1 Tax=Malikia spinosa TaxID=86180 RepID=A0A7C9MVA0_9BURK|nr:magnesium transporter CorA family protein [Malikia spinosa]MYZ52637.1 magnesium transporter CorA family protein [Malikia spinosa]
MRVFHLAELSIRESAVLPTALPESGFLWIALGRREFEAQQAEVQACLQQLCGSALVDLHLSDLLNNQLPSHYDYTAQYDLLVFRRLAQGRSDIEPEPYSPSLGRPARGGGPPVLRRIDTSPVGFALFDQVLLTVHPTDCAVRDGYAARLLALTANGHAEFTEPGRSAAVRFMPSSSGDLMLRLVNQMVDGYLELRRELTRQLDHWQAELLNPKSRFNNWSSLLQVRLALHQLDEICEDQRSAIQDWIEALDSWPEASMPLDQRAHELLKVRSRDVLEHIERVVHHVRRLEQSAEVAVQMHFNAQGHRTNEIMRILTVLTAIFLPLNLIAGIFGMNFDFIPLLHLQAGFWWAMTAMVVIAVSLVFYFWRKRFLEHRT